MSGDNVYEAAGLVLLRETGCTVRRWRAGNSGRAFVDDDDWGIEVPRARGPISFGVFAHEIGHQLLHRHGRRPRWREEVEAEEYALEQFQRFGLAGRDRYQRHAAKHLGYSFRKAVRRSRAIGEVIVTLYPRWWALAEILEYEAMLEPLMSEERRALDEAPA